MIATTQLRPATDNDLAAIEQLLTQNDLPLDGVREALRTFVVAEADGDLVGVAGLEICRDNALLRSVAVSPAWRSRGVGRALVTRAVSEAEARGLRALYLLTTTAEKYFPRFGFTSTTRAAVPQELKSSAEFRGACPDTAVVMRRRLGRSTGTA